MTSDVRLSASSRLATPEIAPGDTVLRRKYEMRRSSSLLLEELTGGNKCHQLPTENHAETKEEKTEPMDNFLPNVIPRNELKNESESHSKCVGNKTYHKDKRRY